MSNTLKKITAEAKRIRKRHPAMQWKTAVKEAGAKYRKGKIGGTRRKKVVRKKVGRRIHAVKRKVSGIKRRVSRTVGNVTASQHMSHAKAKLQEEVGWLEAMKLSAKTAKTRNSLQKRINEKKRIYRKLCSK